MSGELYLDWAILAVSLFTTILLLWLGLTVLFNAEQRGRLGIWLSGGGLLVGAALFISHSAMVGLGLSFVSQGMDFWWRASWVPAVSLPFAWYVVMLWYAGYWDDPFADLHRRQRPLFFITVLMVIGLVGLMIFANPVPYFSQMALLKLSPTPMIGRFPVLVLAYPLYILACISLSFDALRRPVPSGRVMGDLARHRARPWLISTTLVLLAVSLLVGWAMLWVIFNSGNHPLFGDNGALTLAVAWFDLAIETLIAFAVLLLGQAVVSYEIFTGKTLPRRGLQRQWRSVVLLAAGYSILVGWTFTREMRPIYVLLGATVLMALAYALFAWRSYSERDRYIEHLRPFVASHGLYEDMTHPAAAEVDLKTPFHALCRDVLGVKVAYLAAHGPLAPLVASPLSYPEGTEAPLLPLEDIGPMDHPSTMCVPVDERKFGGALWAVPLWSERGLIGMLLLGEKRDGGLYTQEEMEIAREVGERLIDTQASVEMAQRLMALQRQRMAESQVLDRRTRRALHDDVLPRLHAAMLSLGPSAPPEAISTLASAHKEISDLLREMPTAGMPEVSRMGVVGALQRTVEEEFAEAFDAVTWEVDPEASGKAHSVPSMTAEVLYYAAREAIRNAARHGRSGDTSRPLHLNVKARWQNGLEMLVEDDGVGLGAAGNGNSHAGSGQGLALHSTLMAVVGGSLAVESVPGRGTRIHLAVPQSQ